MARRKKLPSAERLLITDFGPIRKAEIEVRDLTDFIGPQAAGKSLAAQCLSFMRGMEDLQVPASVAWAGDEEALPPGPFEAIFSSLRWWLGRRRITELGAGSLIQLRDQQIQWLGPDDGKLSPSLKLRVQKWLLSRKKPLAASALPDDIYIPAGRSLYSFLPSDQMQAPISAGLVWPGSVHQFYGLLGAVLERFRQAGGWPVAIAPGADLLQQMEQVLKGRLYFSKQNAVLLSVRSRSPFMKKRLGLRPVNLAAGQMELWPFWTILADLFSREELDLPCFYFEEPEAHLHPGAQRDLMQVVASLVNQGMRFVITTHSPYVLHVLNNYLMAHQIIEAGRRLPAGIDKRVRLSPDQVAVYHFSEEGMARPLMDAESGLIEAADLDDVAAKLNASFSEMLDRMGDRG